MLAPLMDLKDTTFYKDVLKEGEARGEARGRLLGEIQNIEVQLEEYDEDFQKGIYPEDLYRKRRTLAEKKLSEKKAALEKL